MNNLSHHVESLVAAFTKFCDSIIPLILNIFLKKSFLIIAMHSMPNKILLYNILAVNTARNFNAFKLC